MLTLPNITIAILTYSRFEEIQQVVASLRANVLYPPENIQWLIADDCSPDDYLERLKACEVFNGLNVRFISTQQNSGWGASANNLLDHVETDFLYLSEDDYVLSFKLDMRVGIGILETCPDVGLLRYGGTSGDMLYTYHQHEANVSEYVKENIYAADYVEGRATYLIIDVDSPSLYVYSGRPQLGKLNWYYKVGLFPEGLSLGAGENAMCHKVKDYIRSTPDAPQIAILPDFVNMKYRHIGANSFQNSAHDIARSGA
jgi:glycosyltransferase involved in cell wall biosynthesis